MNSKSKKDLVFLFYTTIPVYQWLVLVSIVNIRQTTLAPLIFWATYSTWLTPIA